MKDYIRDDGKIRNCTSNIAKMNVFEYMWFDLTNNKVIKYGLIDTLKQYKEVLQNLFYAITNTILIIFFPISLLMKAISTIKHAKVKMENNKKIFGN